MEMVRLFDSKSMTNDRIPTTKLRFQVKGESIWFMDQSSFQKRKQLIMKPFCINNTINSNTCSFNTEAGIHLEDSSHNEIMHNHLFSGFWCV